MLELRETESNVKLGRGRGQNQSVLKLLTFINGIGFRVAKIKKVIGSIIRHPVTFTAGAYVAEFKRRTSRLPESLLRIFREARVAFTVKHIHGCKRIKYTKNDVVALCLVKNGELYIRSFIEHYKWLGVRHIVLLDNGSTDRTIAIAKEYPDITVLQTLLPYKAHNLAMKGYLLSRFASNNWGLLADVDELFDYPRSDILTLGDLIQYLNESSYTAVVAQMLDMFSENGICETLARESYSLRQDHRYYDISDIRKSDYLEPNTASNPEIKIHFGGIRETLFGVDSLLLTKHALIFNGKKVKLVTPHLVENARIADFSCVLYHYIFVDDFYRKTRMVVEMENYYNRSAEYKKYWAVLKKSPRLEIRQRISLRLNSVADLVDNRFLIVSDRFTSWAEHKKRIRRVAGHAA